MAQDGSMSEIQIPGIRMDTRLLKLGGTIASAGLLLATAGSVLVSVAVTRAGRSWIKQHDVDPVATATAKLQQAKGASAAGIQAWRSVGQTAPDGVAQRTT
jgi:hypothetical protein